MRSYLKVYSDAAGRYFQDFKDDDHPVVWAMIRTRSKADTMAGFVFLMQFAEIVCYFHDSDGNRVEIFAANPISFVNQINWLSFVLYKDHPLD